MTTIHDLASHMAAAFDTRTRDNLEAHGDMLPDDWIYFAVQDAVLAIDDAGPDADLDDARDSFVDAVAIYNGNLLRWLSSHLSVAELEQLADPE